MQNTGVGEGVAIPHATLPGVQRSYLGVFTTSKPVSYGASDERGVDVFFVTVGPPEERKTHLLMLSNLARLVSTEDFLGHLRGLRESREVIDLFQTSQEEESSE